MAETRTTRFQLPQWSSGATDAPSREDFNEAFANIEKWAGRWETGTLATRPNPEVVGRYFVDETGVIYRDTGSAWQQIGTPKNTLRITKTDGNDPAITAEVPVALGVDAYRSLHDTKTRFRVTATGDVIGSSVRLYQSDTAPPAADLNHTLSLIAKAAASSGLTVYGTANQTGNLVEVKNNAGADLSLMTATGDMFALGRVSAGSLVAVDAQMFTGSTGPTRPALLARTSQTAPSNSPLIVAETQAGTKQVGKLDGFGRLAIGNRDSKDIIDGDNFAINLNYASTNSGSNPLRQARVVFRNGSAGAGPAGLDVRQEPGDTTLAGSLGFFAGTSTGADNLAPERLRLGINPGKLNARIVVPAPDWTALQVRGAEGQTAPLLSLVQVDGTSVMQVAANGDINARKITTTSTEPVVFNGEVNASGVITGTALRAIQGAGNAAGVLSQIKAAATQGAHFLAQDENGTARAQINRDGTLEIAKDTSVVPAGSVLLSMRGVQYRQNGRKLQTYDAEAQKWGSFDSALSAEYYTQSQQSVKDQWVGIKWFGEVNDTEGVYGFNSNSSVITVPYTGLYDVRALAHVEMNFTGGGTATFRVNGVNEMKYRRDFARVLGWDVCTLSLNDLLMLNAGDQLEFMVRIDSFLFSTRTLNTGDYRSRLSIRFAGYAT
ncbi:hypothetical protein SEA_DALANDE_53 [Gordonia phage DalanDe]|nr:hypothetical protein SEA_DALANDE_53 [Gordonia phage DalanDe]